MPSTGGTVTVTSTKEDTLDYPRHARSGSAVPEAIAIGSSEFPFVNFLMFLIILKGY
jgi:hypothetical protein